MNKLSDELTADPLGRGYAALGDVACAALLATCNRPVLGAIARADFVIWAAAGPRAAIEDTALTSNHPLRASALSLRASALSLRDFVSGNSESLDLANPAVQQLLQAWVAADLITQAQHDTLIDLATHVISRAEELGIADASANAVMEARR